MDAASHPYFADRPLALAHRGGAAWGPNVGRENTLVAFVAAVEELGFTHVETDVHATADGALVALHDARLDRVSDGTTGAVAELTLEETRRARIAGEPVPTLDEILTRLPDTRLNIDLKSPAAVRPLVAELDRHGAHRRVCVGSFSNVSLWRFRVATRGQVATSAGRLGIVALRFLPSWLSRLVHSPALAYQVPVDQRVGVGRLRVVTPAFIAAAHRIGRQVHVWTIDDPAQMHALLDLGVDGIVTDRPDLLRDVLRDRGAGPGHSGPTGR